MPPGPVYNWLCVAHSVVDILSIAMRLRAEQVAAKTGVSAGSALSLKRKRVRVDETPSELDDVPSFKAPQAVSYRLRVHTAPSKETKSIPLRDKVLVEKPVEKIPDVEPIQEVYLQMEPSSSGLADDVAFHLTDQGANDGSSSTVLQHQSPESADVIPQETAHSVSEVRGCLLCSLVLSYVAIVR